MHTGTGQVVELMLRNGLRHVWISCPTNLIPAPGQYLLAGNASDSPLPVSIFYTDSSTGGFITASPLPVSWTPGQEIYLRGPLGRGFALPAPARRVALVALDDSIVHLYGLIPQALKQGAAIVLICNVDADGLPDEVEVQPFSALDEALQWADYAAFDVERENLPELRERLMGLKQVPTGVDAQVLIHAPVPCGGIADCGVCSVVLKSDWNLACKDGPVFDLRDV